MYYFHIQYIIKKKRLTYVLKAKSKRTAINKFHRIMEKNNGKFKLLKCKRSNTISSSYSRYCLKDAKYIVYQNLSKKTKKKLTVKDVKTILKLFYIYLEENGFIKINKDSIFTKTISHVRDENIPSCYEGKELVLSAGDVCSFTQYESLIRKKKLFYFNDIYNVFVAESIYLLESDISS